MLLLPSGRYTCCVACGLLMVKTHAERQWIARPISRPMPTSNPFNVRLVQITKRTGAAIPGSLVSSMQGERSRSVPVEMSVCLSPRGAGVG